MTRKWRTVRLVVDLPVLDHGGHPGGWRWTIQEVLNSWYHEMEHHHPISDLTPGLPLGTKVGRPKVKVLASVVEAIRRKNGWVGLGGIGKDKWL